MKTIEVYKQSNETIGETYFVALNGAIRECTIHSQGILRDQIGSGLSKTILLNVAGLGIVRMQNSNYAYPHLYHTSDDCFLQQNEIERQAVSVHSAYKDAGLNLVITNKPDCINAELYYFLDGRISKYHKPIDLIEITYNSVGTWLLPSLYNGVQENITIRTEDGRFCNVDADLYLSRDICKNNYEHLAKVIRFDN